MPRSIQISRYIAMLPALRTATRRIRLLESNTSLHVEVSATTDDPVHPILCLPGALGTARTDFEPQLEELPALNSDFNVISFDPRGYGKSRPPRRDYPLNFLERDADDAKAIMDQLGYKKFSVIGWSDGANSGAILAAKYPESVNRLVLIGGNAYISQEDVECMRSISDISTWSEKMYTALHQVYGSDLQPMWTEWFKTYTKLHTLGGDLICSYLPEIKCKTLVTAGTKDPLVPTFHAEYLHERIGHSKLHWFEGGKHNVHLKFASEFNQLVAEFLTQPDDKTSTSREFVAIPKL